MTKIRPATFLIEFIVLCMIMPSFAQETQEETSNISIGEQINKPGWELTFHDEFDSISLDQKKWFSRYRAGIWSGIPAYYVIENGILHLRIDDKLPKRSEKYDSTVSSLQTSEITKDAADKKHFANAKFVQKYGWFEMRCRMPSGSGLHSAFWLLHADPYDQEYTLDGKRRKIGDGVVEIDIFEQLGAETNKHINRFNIHFTRNGAKQFSMGFDPSEQFHVYALEWKEGQLDWYIDGKKVHTYKGETPQKEMFIFISLYQGSGWTGPVDRNMPYPRDFEIDYIRVYKREDEY